MLNFDSILHIYNVILAQHNGPFVKFLGKVRVGMEERIRFCESWQKQQDWYTVWEESLHTSLNSGTKIPSSLTGSKKSERRCERRF